MNRPRITCALAVGLFSFLAAGHSQPAYPAPGQINSASGQFNVSVVPETSYFYRRPDFSTNKEILQLDAPLLTVSAERFKVALWHLLGYPADTPWSGKIYLRLHSARSLDEQVIITAKPFLRTWDFQVELPDLVTRSRFVRALTSVLLLEIANRQNPVTGHAVDLPPWLAEGLARQILEADGTKVILSMPTRTVDGLAQTRVTETKRGLDPLTEARKILQNSPALTFQQLSWPTGDQLTGADGGVYLASAQLFVGDLLNLKDGPARVRDLLARLPGCQNWQTAFLAAFAENFPDALAVEKWWALRVVNFAARAPGPRWTTAVSRDRLNAILAVPVDIRYASNAMPSRAQISLQAAIENFEPPKQTEILENKLRDLNLVQLRLAAPLAPVGNEYRVTLLDFLEREKKLNSVLMQKKIAVQLVRDLDAIDQHRKAVETRLDRQAPSLPGQ